MVYLYTEMNSQVNSMIRKEQDGIQWLEFELFAQFPEVPHGVFLRHGGSSVEPYGSLNISVQGGDDEKAVEKNRQAIADCLSCPSYLLPVLEHGKRVVEISSTNCVRPVCDGLLTRSKGVGLLITHADCQAAIFYDPANRILANVHAGWRGNVQNIYAETVRRMEELGTRAEDLFVGISPSLCPEHAEFVNYRTELPEALWKYQERPDHFNLWEISRNQLEEAGVPSDQIEIAGISTYSNPVDYYSYRRDRETGRHGTLAYLKDIP